MTQPKFNDQTRVVELAKQGQQAFLAHDFMQAERIRHLLHQRYYKPASLGEFYHYKDYAFRTEQKLFKGVNPSTYFDLFQKLDNNIRSADPATDKKALHRLCLQHQILVTDAQIEKLQQPRLVYQRIKKMMLGVQRKDNLYINMYHHLFQNTPIDTIFLLLDSYYERNNDKLQALREEYLVDLDNIPETIITHDFEQALIYGDYLRVSYYLLNGIALQNQYITPLEVTLGEQESHLISCSGDLAFFIAMLKHGASYTETGFENALKSGNLDIVDLYENNGYSIRQNDIQFIVQSGNPTLAERYFERFDLPKHLNHNELFNHAVKSGTCALIKLLVKKGVKPPQDPTVQAQLLEPIKNFSLAIYLTKNLHFNCPQKSQQEAPNPSRRLSI